MFCRHGTCKKKEHEMESCNIALNIPITYGSSTIVHPCKRCILFSDDPKKVLASTESAENIPVCHLKKNRCVCSKNKTFTVETVAKNLEEYKNFGKPLLVQETWYCQYMKPTDLRGYPQDINFHEKRKKDYTTSTPLLIKSKINDQERDKDIERRNNKFYEIDRKIDKKEGIQPSFVVKSPGMGSRRKGKLFSEDDSISPGMSSVKDIDTFREGDVIQPAFASTGIEMEEVDKTAEQNEEEFVTNIAEKSYVIKYDKINNFPSNLLYPNILTFGGICVKAQKQIFSLEDTGRLINLYDPVQNQWKCLGFMPISRSHHTAVLVNNEIYIIGGLDHCKSKRSKLLPTSDVISYNINTHEWYRRASLQTPRAVHNSVICKEVIYTLGGEGYDEKILKSVEKYDSSLRKWIEVQEMLYPVTGAASCVVDNCIFVIGGVIEKDDNEKRCVSSVMIYNIEQDRWLELKQPLPYPVAYGSCCVKSNAIWLIGGQLVCNDTVSFARVFMLDLQRMQWNEVDKLLVLRNHFACVSIESFIFIIGGFDTESKLSLDDMEVIRSINSPNLPLTPLPTALKGIAAIALNPTVDPTYPQSSKFDNIIRNAYLLLEIEQNCEKSKQRK